MMRVRLTTLDRLKREIGTEKTTADTDFSRYIDNASGLITSTVRRQFVPTYETWRYRRDAQRDAFALQLDRDLLEVIQLLTPSGGTLASTDYQLLPLNESAKYRIELTQEGGQAWNFPSRSGTVTLTGWWGYHDDYANAWDATDTLQGTLTASGTTVRVALSQTLNGTIQPVFEVGDYIRVTTAGTVEAMRTTAGTVTSGTPQLTVIRGELGTTAIAHTGTGVPVDRYQHVRDVQAFADRLAVWFYQNKDLVSSYFEVADGTVRINSTLQGELEQLVRHYDRMRFEVI